MLTSSSPKTSPTSRPSKGRKSFVRTKVPLAERIASVTIVLLLGTIGSAVFIKGRNFDSSLYSLPPEALKSTASQVEGKLSTVREKTGAEEGTPLASSSLAASAPASAATNSTAEPTEGAESTPDAGASSQAAEGDLAAKPAPPIAKVPLEIKVPGAKPMSETEYYSADNLFEKIDGRAPAYLAFNFQQLRNRSFTIADAPDSYVDIYEFRMDTPINAFGAFAMERDPKGTPLDFIHDGYAGALGFYFRQGSVYVQVIASDEKPKTLAMAKAIALDRVKSIPADDAGLQGLRKLPAPGLLPESITFVQDNAQGQEFLKNVFQATYQFEEQKLPFFVMSSEPQAASKAWDSYLAFCGKFGGKATVLPEINGSKLFKAQSFGSWKVIYCKQSSAGREAEVGGVYDATNPDKAQKFVEKYLKGELQ